MSEAVTGMVEDDLHSRPGVGIDHNRTFQINGIVETVVLQNTDDIEGQAVRRIRVEVAQFFGCELRLIFFDKSERIDYHKADMRILCGLENQKSAVLFVVKAERKVLVEVRKTEQTIRKINAAVAFVFQSSVLLCF